MDSIAVIGCGLLGIKIAGELSLRGADIRMYDREKNRRDEALIKIEEDRESLKRRNLFDDSVKVGQILVFDRLEDALRGVKLVSEAICDVFSIKKELFEEIGEICSENTILTSNTLDIDFTKVVEHVKHKERTAGLRFLYPVYGINEAEFTPTSYTSNDTILRVQNLLHRMNKTLFLRKGEDALILDNNEREQRNQQNFRENFDKIPVFGNKCLENKYHEDEVSDSDGRMKCVVCIHDDRNTLLSPCNHIALCCTCAEAVQKRQEPCPICRSPIRSVVRVYHS